MATQKQRKRRAKEKRHEYELVYVDENGVEQPVEREESPRKPPARVGKSGSDKTSSKAKPTRGGGRRGREVQPPSWSKVAKRGAIFAPIFFATVMLLGGKKVTIPAAILQSLLLLAVFVPFSYFMDRFVWRQQQKRLGRDA
jgi:hypothetical protein